MTAKKAIDYKAEAANIAAEVREGATKDRMLLIAARVETLKVPAENREDFANNIAKAYADATNMANNTYTNFKSSVKTVCTVKAPGVVARIISEMIRDGQWTIKNSYIPGAFKRCEATASDNEIRDIVAKYIAEKTGGSGAGGSNQSPFKNVSKILKGENVSNETWQAGVDEMESALKALYAKRNAKLPKTVTNALESIRKPKK